MPQDYCFRDLFHGLSPPTFKFIPTPLRMTALLQGVGLNILSVLLHKVFLKTNLITEPVVVGVRPSLPVRKVWK